MLTASYSIPLGAQSILCAPGGILVPSGNAAPASSMAFLAKGLITAIDVVADNSKTPLLSVFDYVLAGGSLAKGPFGLGSLDLGVLSTGGVIGALENGDNEVGGTTARFDPFVYDVNETLPGTAKTRWQTEPSATAVQRSWHYDNLGITCLGGMLVRVAYSGPSVRVGEITIHYQPWKSGAVRYRDYRSSNLRLEDIPVTITTATANTPVAGMTRLDLSANHGIGVRRRFAIQVTGVTGLADGTYEGVAYDADTIDLYEAGGGAGGGSGVILASARTGTMVGASL